METYDLLLLCLGLLGVIAIAGGLYSLTATEEEEGKKGGGERRVNRRARGGGAGQRLVRGNALPRVEEEEVGGDAEEKRDFDDEDEEEVGEEGDNDSDGEDIAAATAGMSKAEKKAYIKKQKKAAKKEKGNANANMRNARDDKLSAREEKYKAKLEEREAARLIEEEKEKEEEDKKAKAAEAEYDQWKDMFSVEGEGTGEEDKAGAQGKLNDFINYIKKTKVVVLEEVANEFGMRSQEVLSRIQDLEAMGRITGVFDDRGKFIYITNEEMDRVTNYINEQGRVSVSNLAAASNELIMLNKGEEDEENDQAGGNISHVGEVDITTVEKGRGKHK